MFSVAYTDVIQLVFIFFSLVSSTIHRNYLQVKMALALANLQCRLNLSPSSVGCHKYIMCIICSQKAKKKKKHEVLIVCVTVAVRSLPDAESSLHWHDIHSIQLDVPSSLDQNTGSSRCRAVDRWISSLGKCIWLKKQMHNMQSPPKVLEQQRSIPLLLLYTEENLLYTEEFEVKRCTWDGRFNFSSYFLGLDIR